MVSSDATIGGSWSRGPSRSPTCCGPLRLSGFRDRVRETSRSLSRRACGHHVVRQLSRRRLTGFASAAVRGGALELSEPQSAELLQRHVAAMGMVAVLEHLLHEVATALSGAGMVPVVLKGLPWRRSSIRIGVGGRMEIWMS